jgi:hypothetical protein
MNPKLILPAEVKVCATCSYWDGERKVDTELRLVVVEETCEGECLVQEKCCTALNDESTVSSQCLWEHLAPDVPGDSASDSASNSISDPDSGK